MKNLACCLRDNPLLAVFMLEEIKKSNLSGWDMLTFEPLRPLDVCVSNKILNKCKRWVKAHLPQVDF